MKPPTEPAGRCIRLIRPHRWTRWRVFVEDPFPRQKRTCLRCGRTKIEWADM